MSLMPKLHKTLNLRQIFSENLGRPGIGKMFKCSLCEKKFLDQSNLRLHSKIHMDPSDFECELCHCYFHTLEGLQAHKRKRHRQSNGSQLASSYKKCKKCSLVFRFDYYLLKAIQSM